MQKLFIKLMPIRHIYENQLSPQQYKNVEQRREYLKQKTSAIHQYRNEMLSQILHHQTFTLDKTEYGKPYVVGENFSFNHSHSDLISALLWTDGLHDIGIDVEDLTRQVRFEIMAQHCFHDDEYQIWQQQGKTPQHWFKIWTVKEAVLKASGLGIRINLKDLNTNMQVHTEHGEIEHEQLGRFIFHVKPCCLLSKYGLIQFMLAIAWRKNTSILDCQIELMA